MLDTLKQLLGIKKKEILLTVPAIFPLWHKRFGDKTGFRQCILDKVHPKIHAFKRNISFWERMERKYRSGGYRFVVCHMGDNPERREYYPIKRSEWLHTQRACFATDGELLYVEDKPVSIDKVALNEGLDLPDLLEWKKQMGTRPFCIVHFTAFRY